MLLLALAQLSWMMMSHACLLAFYTGDHLPFPNFHWDGWSSHSVILSEKSQLLHAVPTIKRAKSKQVHAVYFCLSMHNPTPHTWDRNTSWDVAGSDQARWMRLNLCLYRAFTRFLLQHLTETFLLFFWIDHPILGWLVGTLELEAHWPSDSPGVLLRGERNLHLKCIFTSPHTVTADLAFGGSITACPRQRCFLPWSQILSVMVSWVVFPKAQNV